MLLKGHVFNLRSRFGSGKFERYLYCGSIFVGKKRFRLLQMRGKGHVGKYSLVESCWLKQNWKRIEIIGYYPKLAEKHKKRYVEIYYEQKDRNRNGPELQENRRYGYDG